MAIGIRCSFRNNVIANSLAIAIAGTTFIVSIRRGKCIEEAIIVAVIVSVLLFIVYSTIAGTVGAAAVIHPVPVNITGP